MAQRNHIFFTPTDIALLQKAAGKPYDPSDRNDITLRDQVKADAWGKTLYWHDMVLDRLLGYVGETTTRWHNRGQTFSYYTWTRIYKSGDKGKGIFFTIGIDGSVGGLVYKLDYMHAGKSALVGHQKEVCETMIKKSPAAWMQINAAVLTDYDWSKLVDETVAFIKENESLYDEVMEEAWHFHQKRLARIAYNEEGWQRPSGRYGKSKSVKSHEGRFGYGLEEWLFDKEKSVGGYHYAFLEPIRKYYDLYKGHTFDIVLYTADADTGIRYWIGEIKDLEVIGEDEAEKVREWYRQEGWLAAMKSDIERAGGRSGNFPGKDAVQMFNVRFKPSAGTLYDTPVEVPANNPLYKINRYVLLNDGKQYGRVDFEADTFDFAGHTSPLPQADAASPQSKRYSRPPKMVEMRFLHKEISDKLHLHLAGIYGQDKVKTNVRAGYGCNEVDMIVERDDRVRGLVYYEIKTYDSLRLSIREALGQILEYAMWPDKNRAVRFVIVTQPCPSELGSVGRYMKNLRKNLNIELYYQSFDPETMILSPEI